MGCVGPIAAAEQTRAAGERIVAGANRVTCQVRVEGALLAARPASRFDTGMPAGARRIERIGMRRAFARIAPGWRPGRAAETQRAGLVGARRMRNLVGLIREAVTIVVAAVTCALRACGREKRNTHEPPGSA